MVIRSKFDKHFKLLEIYSFYYLQLTFLIYKMNEMTMKSKEEIFEMCMRRLKEIATMPQQKENIENIYNFDN